MKVLLNQMLRNHLRRSNASELADDYFDPEQCCTSVNEANMAARRKTDPSPKIGQLSRDASSSNLRSSSTKSGKLPVAEPASFRKFFVVLAMHLCRKLLLVNLRTKLAIYAIAVVVVSLVTDLFPLPVIGVALKSSWLNVLFARYGWGWTLAVIGVFMYFTSYTYCCGHKDLVKRHFYRLAVGTAWWYICTSFFDYIEAITGLCSTEFIMSKRECRAEGGVWSGFDISGHTFLMMYNLLLIGEEVKVLAGWDSIREFIIEEEHQQMNRLNRKDLDELKESYEKFTPYVRLSTLAVTFLSMIWEFVLLLTILYYHNMPQKVIGYFFAALGWAVTYQIWYRQGNVWSPGMPGDGLVKYGKAKST